jgi:hypothetical protein
MRRVFSSLIAGMSLYFSMSSQSLAQAVVPGDNIAAMRELSADLATSYLRIWSSGNDAALADVEEVYAPRVRFYGRMLDRRGLVQEKMRFTRRWPIRRYAHRPGTMRVTCDPGRRACLVKSVIDWEAASPARRAASRGSSVFELGVGFTGPQPVVLYEGGEVVGRRRS